MAPLQGTRPLLTKIDEQIVSLLHHRVQQCRELRDGESGITPEEEAEILAYWLEEAADLELDERLMERMCRCVLALSRKTEE